MRPGVAGQPERRPLRAEPVALGRLDVDEQLLGVADLRVDVAVDHALTVSGRALESVAMTARALRALRGRGPRRVPLPRPPVAVTDRNGLIACETFGFASLEARTPVTEETSFEFGSIGKTFTAVVLLQLAEEGAGRPRGPGDRYLRWFEVRSAHAPITLSHLLTHTSGLMTGAELSASSRYDVWALRETEVGFPPGPFPLLERRLPDSRLRRRGGDRTRIRGGTGRRILEPLDLEATDPAVTSEGRHRLAVGYDRRYDDRPADAATPGCPQRGSRRRPGTARSPGRWRSRRLPAGPPERRARRALGGVVRAHEHAGDRGGRRLVVRLRPPSRGTRDPARRLHAGLRGDVLGDLDAGLGVTVAVNGPTSTTARRRSPRRSSALYRDGRAPYRCRPPRSRGRGRLRGHLLDEVGETDSPSRPRGSALAGRHDARAPGLRSFPRRPPAISISPATSSASTARTVASSRRFKAATSTRGRAQPRPRFPTPPRGVARLPRPLPRLQPLVLQLPRRSPQRQAGSDLPVGHRAFL